MTPYAKLRKDIVRIGGQWERSARRHASDYASTGNMVSAAHANTLTDCVNALRMVLNGNNKRGGRP